MITMEYKGKKLSTASSAFVIYYPRLTNGGDYLKDAKNNQLNALLNLYAACRMAADKEARKMSQEDIVNEVEYFDLTDPNSEFYKVITKLLGSNNSKNV